MVKLKTKIKLLPQRVNGSHNSNPGPFNFKTRSLKCKMSAYSPKVVSKLLTWDGVRTTFTLCLSFLVFNPQTQNLKLLMPVKVNFLFLHHMTVFITKFLKTLNWIYL